MVPIPAEYMPDFWNQIATECPLIELTCLLPNGIVVPLKANYNATLAEIKEDLWEEASRMPLYGKLHDISDYIFKIINSMAEVEELNDESRRLSDIRPTGAVLIITECRGNSVDHNINIAIGHLIGKALQDFDALNSSEINDFRFKMRKMGEEIAKKRTEVTWLEKLYYQFPPRIAENSYIMLETIKENKNIKVETKCEYEYDYTDKNNEKEVMQSSSKFFVSPLIKPTKLIEMILSKRANILKIKNERVHEYVLKVCGRDEYLVGDNQIIQFRYIQDCISKDITPTLLTVHIDRVPILKSSDYESVDGYDIRKSRTTSYNSGNTLRKKKNAKSSWSITENFAITVCTASKLNCDTRKITEIGVQAGLFHGGKPLCQPLKTEERLVSEKCDAEFDISLDFDIQVCNIPRNAKLCFVVYELSKYAKGTRTRKTKDLKDSLMNPIAWANTSVFDFKGQLRTGAMTLYMWTYAEDMMSDEVLHPLGTVVSNPNTDYSTALTLNFKGYTADQTLMFPCTESVIEYALKLEQEQILSMNTFVLTVDNEMENCKRLINEMDNFYDVHDQDRKVLWSHRRYWMRNMPEILPKLLSCIDWDKREEVCQVIALLREWPKLPVEKSLELLDYAYADQEVRSFAVKCLMDVSDEDLQLYLLQLVQAIKHELYLECDLVHFLIKRALTNQKIGHFLFWHLRSEMQVAAVSVRFGLILEAYCRGSQEHMIELQRQLQSIDKLKTCSDMVRERKDKEKAKAVLKDHLGDGKEVEPIRSPLDPSYRWNGIKVEKCRVMDSKMKPLWVVFENSDPYGDDIYLIFKNGDDLRQDMLTLQMLKVMDRLWKSEGLDLRMNPYNCISLEHKVGMIEIVLNAETIANIQKEKGIFTATAAFRKGPILAWLKDYNTTEAALKKAINEFTLSCAGYCVATYVLGIADRHSDNIMVKQNGQLFHIDFGHILGHFKEKFGIKRERVPFVLTHDFVYVINKGQKTALEFKIFQEYCEKAFLILRKYGNLLLSLLAMMISTGLPELSCEKDLHYLRETLVLNKTEEEALEHFRQKFNEALSNSWKTSLNWASHNISKNNKV
ncbi:phosphatidylinositol 4,5-bisphosphate 3-kinase catalytic subunit delta isoform [Cylas formicarius]|uniref:phosphatidylinositol 4,5-bisphosphate 3-kinase catalytic subunit delta isoform n=1 Tax=Cylas formicarius TaxID=197179 RepID=UPI0029587890|nr:phosphatidylinositol 4,5-bisphosphate 3-kinase catalytic subunit delta isoform [Cylas formicarius]